MRPGSIVKNSHPGGVPKTKLYFLLAFIPVFMVNCHASKIHTITSIFSLNIKLIFCEKKSKHATWTPLPIKVGKSCCNFWKAVNLKNKAPPPFFLKKSPPPFFEIKPSLPVEVPHKSLTHP